MRLIKRYDRYNRWEFISDTKFRLLLFTHYKANRREADTYERLYNIKLKNIDLYFISKFCLINIIMMGNLL